MPLKRPIQTRFRYGYPHGLTSRHNTNSQAHSSKARCHPKRLQRLCKHTVSGTISLPSRGTFHHSLTVLIHYRSLEVFRLTRWSWQIHEIPRAPCYSGGHTTDRTISITGLSPSTADHSKSFTYHPRHHAGSQLELPL